MCVCVCCSCHRQLPVREVFRFFFAELAIFLPFWRGTCSAGPAGEAECHDFGEKAAPWVSPIPVFPILDFAPISLASIIFEQAQLVVLRFPLFPSRKPCWSINTVSFAQVNGFLYFVPGRLYGRTRSSFHASESAERTGLVFFELHLNVVFSFSQRVVSSIAVCAERSFFFVSGGVNHIFSAFRRVIWF